MIELHGLKLGYGASPIVEVAQYRLADHEYCMILGPSGSGKTTLLYALARLLTPLAGTITIDGTPVTQLRGAALDRFRGRNIGMVYQTLHMVPALSVIDNVLLAAYAAGLPQDRKRATGLLDQLGIGYKRDEAPQRLSQGEQQRVAIARAVMNRPKVLLCDEPTSALDDRHCEAVMHCLLDAARECGAHLVVATHDARIKRHFGKTIGLGGTT